MEFWNFRILEFWNIARLVLGGGVSIYIYVYVWRHRYRYRGVRVQGDVGLRVQDTWALGFGLIVIIVQVWGHFMIVGKP